MVHQSSNPNFEAENDSVLAERVQELSWALLDEQIEEGELALLDSLLLSDDKARRTYIDCIQLHADLVSHFDGKQEHPAAPAKSPVLGFLNAGVPSLLCDLPSADDVIS